MKHRKRKIAALVLALVLALLAVGGTWAYFTYEGRATNVITTGTVELDLSNGKTADGLTATSNARVSHVMPGTTVEYKPKIQNVGTAPFYVRVKADVTITAAGGDGLPGDVVTLTCDTDNWELHDGWYYCKKAVSPGENGKGETVTPFSAVNFDAKMGNDYQGCTVELAVVAQAVQVKNNEMTDNDVTTIMGWPAVAEPEE